MINFCADSPCGSGARCDNSRGSYKCFCPIGTVGDPYHDGCHAPVECSHNEDCPIAAECMQSNGIPKCKGMFLLEHKEVGLEVNVDETKYMGVIWDQH